MTTGQLGHRLRQLCIETDPADARRRYNSAVSDRRIACEPDPAGTAHLFAMDLPPHRLAAGMQRINRIAKDLRRNGETRTMDQLRGDVLLDLLEGTEPRPPCRAGVCSYPQRPPNPRRPR